VRFRDQRAMSVAVRAAEKQPHTQETDDIDEQLPQRSALQRSKHAKPRHKLLARATNCTPSMNDHYDTHCNAMHTSVASAALLSSSSVAIASVRSVPLVVSVVVLPVIVASVVSIRAAAPLAIVHHGAIRDVNNFGKGVALHLRRGVTIRLCVCVVHVSVVMRHA
jgi:hypothetical protein